MSRPPCLAPSNSPGHDIVSMSRPPGGHPMSRHHIGVATLSLPPSIKPGRDFISRSRPPRRPTYVATSSSCRDIKFPTGQVATSVPCRDLLETNLCRDINFMSRPHSCPQWDFQVVTSHAAIHVATSKMMSRHPINSAPFLLRRNAILPYRDVPCSHPCRDLKMMPRHQFPLAKPETHCNPSR